MLPAIAKVIHRQQIQRKILKLCSELEACDLNWVFEEALKLITSTDGPVPINTGAIVDDEIPATPPPPGLTPVDTNEKAPF